MKIPKDFLKKVTNKNCMIGLDLADVKCFTDAKVIHFATASSKMEDINSTSTFAKSVFDSKKIAKNTVINGAIVYIEVPDGLIFKTIINIVDKIQAKLPKDCDLKFAMAGNKDDELSISLCCV
jgi:hypothetical protein